MPAAPASPIPVLCLPGWSTVAAVWEPLRRALPGRELRHVPLGSATTPADFPRLARQALAACAEPQVLLLGWSLGALLALDLAAAEPARIAGLVLVGGTTRFCSDDPELGWAERVVQRMRRSLSRSPGETLEQFQAAMFSPAEVDAGQLAGYRAAIDPSPADADAWTPEALDAGLQWLASADQREALLGWRGPLRWLHGSADAICPPGAADFAASLATLRDPWRLTRLPGVGHALPWTATATLAAAIQELAAPLPITDK